jgi:hypothetical protein
VALVEHRRQPRNLPSLRFGLTILCAAVSFSVARIAESGKVGRQEKNVGLPEESVPRPRHESAEVRGAEAARGKRGTKFPNGTAVGETEKL